MSLDFIHRPLGDRSTFGGDHKPSPFDSTQLQTMRLLEDELWHLDGHNVVGAFDRSEGRERYRRARAMVHPDRQNGDQTRWDQVELAAKVLGLTS